LQYLQEVLPNFAQSLVDWETLRERSDLLLITRSGIVPDQDLGQIGLPVINLSQLGSQKVQVQ